MKFLLTAGCALAFLFTTSCNTFIGMGRDLRQLGQGMENTAKKNNGSPAGDHSQGGAPVY